jgi:hypothetical protein
MKFGIRKPSLKRRIAARTSAKRYLRHSLGLKAPRGWGWVTNPRKAAYNRVYNRTSVSVDTLVRGAKQSGVQALVLATFFGFLSTILGLFFSRPKTLERSGPEGSEEEQK